MTTIKLYQSKFKNKILFFDCETSLLTIFAHCIGSKQNIGHYQVDKDKKIICICYMGEGDKKVSSLSWDKSQCDREMLTKFTELVKKYDILVAQNGDAFDLKVIRGRLWIEQLEPLQDVVTLDTLKMSRTNFKLTSHKLDYKSKVIGRDGKIPTDFKLWVDVEKGNKKALKQMIEYCKQDVIELREVFWSMLPYCKIPHRLGLLVDEDKRACISCGSTNIQKRGKMVSGQGIKIRLHCQDCGKWFSLPKSLF